MNPEHRSITRQASFSALLLWLLLSLSTAFAGQDNGLQAAEAARVKKLVAKAEKIATQNPDSAGNYYQQASEIYRHHGLAEEASIITVKIAEIESARHNPHKGLQILLAALARQEKEGNEKAIAHLCTAIGDIYQKLQSIEGGNEFDLNHQEKLIEKARQYYNRALPIFTKYQNTEKQASVNYSLGNLYLEKGETTLALPYYEQAMEFYQQTGNMALVAGINSNLSYLKLYSGREQEGIELAKKALAYYRENNDYYRQGMVHNNLGAYFTMQERQPEAIPHYRQALEFAIQGNDLELHQSVAGNLYWAYKDLNQPAKALEFYELYSLLDDSLFNLSRAQQIADLQEKYEAEKKQRQIELLQKDKELQQANISRRTWERNATIAGLIFTLLLAYFIIRNIRQRQKATALLAAKNHELHQKKIQELLRDQELASVHGVLQGQEAERKRIAQDLHDRLGSLLATVKLHFQMAKTQQQRDTANALIDEACQEVRQIAHNMVSGVLMKFGLVAALNDLARAINATGKVHLQTMAHGLTQRLPGNSEVEIYRIVQELVSNALKHADAKEITVQLTRHGHLLNLMVEDDGRGFSPATAKNKGGMGLQGVQSRVRQLHGELSIDSSPGRGATILIEIPIDTTEPITPLTEPEPTHHDQIIAG